MFGANEIVGKKYYRERPEFTDDKLFVTSMFMTLQGEGPYRGMPAFFIRLAKCNLACSFCFIAGTQITMADNSTKNIEDICIGDEVVSFNETTKIWSTNKVTKTFKTSTKELVELTFDDNTVLVCTSDHPIYDANYQGFVKADQLCVDDSVLTKNSKKIIKKTMKFSSEIADVSKTRNDSSRMTGIGDWYRYAPVFSTSVDTFNIEVENDHTYVANGLLVHNCDTFFDDGDWLTFDEIENRIETTIEDFYKSIEMDRPDWTRHCPAQHEIITGDAAQAIDEDAIIVYHIASSRNTVKKRMVLVMTGGEPMLQDNIGPFLERMSEIFENTQIESNGTQATAIPDSTTLVISPKCLEKKDANGVFHPTRYLTPRQEVLDRADCLKFVMEANPDSPYSVVPDWAHEWANKTGKPIFCSPMNIYNDLPQKAKQKRADSNSISLDERSTVDEIVSFWEPDLLDMKENQKNHEYTAKYCVVNGFILNLQIHLYASLA